MSWNVCENDNTVVELHYSDCIVKVHKSDFDRAFGAIVNAKKQDVIRDFAI